MVFETNQNKTDNFPRPPSHRGESQSTLGGGEGGHGHLRGYKKKAGREQNERKREEEVEKEEEEERRRRGGGEEEEEERRKRRRRRKRTKNRCGCHQPSTMCVFPPHFISSCQGKKG